jgi:diguanylate cyclase (GGDEF)-like protein
MTSAILLVYALRQRTCIYSDALTGLDNRRRVDEYFESIREGLSAESPLRVYLCDVNRFKGINDTYGHVKGDAALVAVGRALRDVGGDLGGMVARWGGDEFIVLSPAGEALAGEASSREIPARVMEDRLNETLAHVCETDGLEFPVRLSVGSAVCSSPELSLDDVTRAADQSLYQRSARSRGCRGVRYGFLYAYTYLCVNVFCAIVSLGFARNVTADIGTRPEVRCMRLILYTFAAYLGVDFLWELGESGLVPLLAGMQAAINVAAASSSASSPAGGRSMRRCACTGTLRA